VDSLLSVSSLLQIIGLLPPPYDVDLFFCLTLFFSHIIISIIYTDCLNGGYKPVFTNRLQLEEALTYCKTTLESNLKENVNLVRVSAPLFVTRASGFNDNLNGVEKPATFEPRDFKGTHLEVP
jgi:hypothetical protein